MPRPDQRPDPDALLAQVRAEEAKSNRGRLKLFFGAAAGVGKTYTMLEEARALLERGIDVMVGWVETHGRAETAAKLAGLPVLAPRKVAHKGAELLELDLDAALARHPKLLLVDELAHTNAPGSRHAKRWQDVEELLAAGIDVFSAMNVQHIESLNDVVAQITGVIVKETVPDLVLEQAAEVELIDLPPEELLTRLADGKIYVPEQARRALQSFFRKGNLTALRELALRTTADRVDRDVRAYRSSHAIAQTWPVSERLLVCVGASPGSTRMVRAARRLADRLGAEWLAVHVETPETLQASQADRDRLAANLRLAASLGAETLTIGGSSLADEVVALARQRNVSKVVVGKPAQRGLARLLRRSPVEALLRTEIGIDVYVIAGEGQEEMPLAVRHRARPRGRSYLLAALAVGLATAVDFLLVPYFREANLVMVYLLALALLATKVERRVSALATVFAVAAFDFFFVPPHLTFAVSDSEYLVTFGVMLIVGSVISTLAARLRSQLAASRQREARTAALYAFSKDLSQARDLDALLGSAAARIWDVFLSQVLIVLPDDHGILHERAAESVTYRFDEREQAVASWVFAQGKMAGMTTDTLPAAKGLYLPLRTARGTLGVLGLHPAAPQRFLAPDELAFLEAFSSQLAMAVEREQSLA
jgi:two-component system sensor histidine kinase KdpD